MLILYSEATLLHSVSELIGAKIIPALESPERISRILDTLSTSHQHPLQQIPAPDSDSNLIQLTERTHDSGYVRHVQEVFKKWRDDGLVDEDGTILPECFPFSAKGISISEPPKDIYARVGYYAFDMSSGIGQNSYQSIVASANLAVQAVQEVRRGRTNVLALCRPPGHHCDGRKAGGYCYINNAAVAITEWKRTQGADARAAILDLDFHHGNGTQEIFYGDAKTFYTSIHGADEFPYYTGKEEERGEGEAMGTNLNLPLASGSSFEQYQQKLNFALSAVRDFKPEFLLVSLGFDTYHLDPLGNFKIETADYEVIARSASSLALPTVILLEGGYALDHIGANLLSFLKGWGAP